ncbi:Squalene epoxidase [Phaffia rhodozyma]|uniref:Squalene monooxygenase n=1 Tax=Phaffia rhodozyma TaxID=264483 RepID=A0A0F7SR14_PHARH|nr:Squalene epoxidase [Phaffia rhodozyma]
MGKFDIIIIGAGIAGSTLAYSLGQSGRRVLCIERDLSTPDRIVGELLQPGGCASLRQLGMGDCLEDIDAVAVEGYCTMYDGHQVEIPYPPCPSGSGSSAGKTPSGRIEGRSFVHGRFVDKLRAKAQSSKNVVMLEGTVKSLLNCPDSSRVIGVSASMKSAAKDTPPQSFYAPVTIIADGCFSRFRPTNAPPPVVRSHFVGLVLHDAPLPIPKHGNVLLGSSFGPVLLYQISTRETRMLVDIKGKLPSIGSGALKEYLEQKVVPGMPSEMEACLKDALDKSEQGGDARLRVMPNSWLPARQQSTGKKEDREGCIVIGDAWNMRHPLTGGGMTVAFHDCVHLTNILAPSSSLPDLEDWHEIAPALRNWYWERKNLSTVVNVLSIALYDLFAADDPNLEVLRQGCFKYFQLGGSAIAGPVSLLSALAPRPLLLFYHFFYVALYSIWCMFFHPQPVHLPSRDGTSTPLEEKQLMEGKEKPQIVWKKPSVTEYPFLVVKSFLVFWTACQVLLPVMWDELR